MLGGHQNASSRIHDLYTMLMTLEMSHDTLSRIISSVFQIVTTAIGILKN